MYSSLARRRRAATALRLPDECQVALLSKGELTASTYYTQGGVAAVLDRKTHWKAMWPTPTWPGPACAG